MDAPKDRIEEPKMFGSDVMFLKKKEQGEGGIFVKYIVNDKPISDAKEFLVQKVRSSKTMAINHLSSVKTVHGFAYVTFKERENYVFAAIQKKDDRGYVFVMLKDTVDHFSTERDLLIDSLKSFKFL